MAVGDANACSPSASADIGGSRRLPAASGWSFKNRGYNSRNDPGVDAHSHNVRTHRDTKRWTVVFADLSCGSFIGWTLTETPLRGLIYRIVKRLPQRRSRITTRQ